MWIDVSVPLDSPHPSWPTSPGAQISCHQDFTMGHSQDSLLTMDVHCGTHVEALAHVRDGGAGLTSFAPDQLCGQVSVVDGRQMVEVPASVLSQVPISIDGILVKTDNSERALMRLTEFHEDFVGWSVEFAEAAAARPGLKFVGADYLSVQPYGGDSRVHAAVLEAGVAIVEGLDLSDVTPGRYEMLGLFLSMPTREAAPARVLLRPVTEGAPS